MNEEDFYIANFNLEINDNIAKMVSKIDDEITEVWKINKKDVLDTINFKEKLIKYLEDKIKECDYQIEIIGNYQKICEKRAYNDILERVKSGKYD